jgi:molybdenum cofactor cytidylyltransferase
MENHQDLRIGAVVLAGGSSERMGEPKQLLRLGETTILECVLESLRRAELDEIVLVLGSHAEAIRRQTSIAAKPYIKAVVNESYRQGMATSLHAGLANLTPEAAAAIIVLADQPFVKSATVSLIAGHYRRTRAKIVIPTYHGLRGNPVLLDRSLFGEAMALRGDIGCRAIFSNHLDALVKLPVDDLGILFDIDTAADFERARRFERSLDDARELVEASRGESRRDLERAPRGAPKKSV